LRGRDVWHWWPAVSWPKVAPMRRQLAPEDPSPNTGPRDAAAEPLVHIEDFRMDFGDTTVIKDLSFDVRAGETFGFLGSNGSGKTTTLRALLGTGWC
jgi:ABC-type molybdenum transport system ATPase subunit/photorepair protein PhrA